MLILAFATTAWIAVLAIVAALAAAAARGDQALARAQAEVRSELAPGIVLLELAGAPLLASANGRPRSPEGESALTTRS
jgi:hypothetical protein